MPDQPCAIVRYEWGRWVADCPVADCWNAEHAGLWQGAVGMLTRDGMACRECGWQGAALWPAPELAEQLLAVLALRPMPSTRNWLPGETVADLLLQNTQHGIGVPELDGDGVLLMVADGRVVDVHPALAAASPVPLAIGA